MTTRRSLIPSVMIIVLSMTRTNAAWAQDLKMTIDASHTGAPIHRYVYGQFTELLGNMYEKGIWAEMLSDRKFFYPINSSQTLNPVNRKRNFERWRPVGGDEFVVMDKAKPFVGEHAPMIKLASDVPHGITQSGLALRKGREYAGRIALAGDSGAKVEVSLIWGDGNDQRQTVAVNSLSDKYVKFPLKFTAGAD